MKFWLKCLLAVAMMLFALGMGGHVHTASAQAASLEEEVNAYLSGLVRLNPKKDGIHLRSGPGTTFESVGQTYEGRLSFLASPDTVTDTEGKNWYKIVYTVERQEDTGYFEHDPSPYIRSDLVRVAPLSDLDRKRVAASKFRILDISPANLPKFRLEQPLVLLQSCFSQARVEIPANTPLLLFSGIFLYENTAYLPVFSPYGTTGIRRLGDIPLEAFEALSFGEAEGRVREWLEAGKHTAGLK